MKNFYIIFVIFVFFTSNSYSCDFRSYSGDIRVVDINGRQIYTLFTTHLRGESDEFRDIFNSDRDIIRRTDRFISKHLDRIISEKSDFRQISRLLTFQEIDWIGIEEIYTDTKIEEQIQDYRGIKELFNRHNNGSLWNQDKTDDLVYLLYHVWLIVLAEYPDETDGIKVISLENRALHARAKVSTLMSLKKRTFDDIADDYYNLTEEQFSAFDRFVSNRKTLLV